MYNLFIGYVSPNDSRNSIEVNVSRYLEYTDSESQMRFRDLSGDTVRAIKNFPALFMQEEVEDGAFVGKITSIKRQGQNYEVNFDRDANFGVISPSVIEAAALELGIESYELHRTHWAVKRGDLYEILTGNSSVDTVVVPQDELPANEPASDESGYNKQVFIVHGHDEHAKADAKAYVESRGLEPIILHLQASGGRTIIEKIDHYTNVGFGIVLYTECDIGAKRGSLGFKWRARQNVVFEHGYLIAKLTRSRVVALVKGDVETPNDISGVVYIGMDPADIWQEQMDMELKQAGYKLPAADDFSF